jgi:Flp pilus assembly pilin Flp
MHELSLKLAAWATDRFYAMRDERGQATVEYVGLTVVLGTGIGLIVTGLDGLGFATKIGSKLIGGITSALGKIT